MCNTQKAEIHEILLLELFYFCLELWKKTHIESRLKIKDYNSACHNLPLIVKGILSSSLKKI